jgi:hypothetical protein
MPLKKQLYLRALILIVLLPVINSFGLRIFNAYTVSGNVAYESVEPLLTGAIQFIEVAIAFCGFGLFLRAFYAFGFKGSAGFLGLNIFSALIPYGAAILTVYITTSDPSSNLPYMLLYGVLNFAMDLVMFAAILGVAAVTAKVAKIAGKHDVLPQLKLFKLGCIWSAVIFFVSGLIQNIGTTISDIIDYGSPTSANDYIYIIIPYLTLIVYTVIGVFIAWFTGTLAMNPPERLQSENLQNTAEIADKK